MEQTANGQSGRIRAGNGDDSEGILDVARITARSGPGRSPGDAPLRPGVGIRRCYPQPASLLAEFSLRRAGATGDGRGDAVDGDAAMGRGVVMNKTAVVTGAGSGVGQAIAIALVKEAWRVAIIGRRAEALEETVRLAGTPGKQLFVCPSCDIGKPDQVAQMARRVLGEFTEVEVLVNAAGTNAPRRALEVLSLEDYHRMIDTNLNGAYYCVQAFLPQMRARKSGTIVNIVSDSGKQASPKAGPAYAMSKFGLTGLT